MADHGKLGLYGHPALAAVVSAAMAADPLFPDPMWIFAAAAAIAVIVTARVPSSWTGRHGAADRIFDD